MGMLLLTQRCCLCSTWAPLKPVSPSGVVDRNLLWKYQLSYQHPLRMGRWSSSESPATNRADLLSRYLQCNPSSQACHWSWIFLYRKKCGAWRRHAIYGCQSWAGSPLSSLPSSGGWAVMICCCVWAYSSWRIEWRNGWLNIKSWADVDETLSIYRETDIGWREPSQRSSSIWCRRSC